MTSSIQLKFAKNMFTKDLVNKEGNARKDIPKVVGFGKRETAGGVKCVHTSTKNLM